MGKTISFKSLPGGPTRYLVPVPGRISFVKSQYKATIRGPILQVAIAKWGKVLHIIIKQKMKRKLLGVFLLLIIFSACQQDPEIPETDMIPTSAPEKAFTLNQTHDALAKVLALSLTDRNVRLFLHAEIGKQFTNDFDILYDLIKDKEIMTEKYGPVSFSGLLKNIASGAGIEFSMFDESVLRYRNLQISSPVYYSNWDPHGFIPLVISLPEEYKEGEKMAVKAYDSDGREMMVLEEELNSPILLVRQAERVDADGMMRVDPDGFVIPQEERWVSAAEAYAFAESHLKSASSVLEEPVIQVLDDEKFHDALVARRLMYAPGETKPVNSTGITPGSMLKSAAATALAAPANFTVHPAGPYTIQLNWFQVPGAVSYEIFRQYQTDPNYLIATVNENQINYFDQNLSIGEHYTYSVRAVDAAGNRSPLTDGKESYASWRTNGRRDVIDRIFIDTDCWRWCCGLFDGKIELQYKISYLQLPGNTNIAYPGSGVISIGQKTKDQQRNKWCYYNHYMFPWDVRNHSYSYRFKMIEDDGDGNGTKIKLGVTFKVQVLKIVDISVSPGIEFTIADKDEEFGEIIIQYWEWKCGPKSYTDGYNLEPNKGKARMYLKQ